MYLPPLRVGDNVLKESCNVHKRFMKRGVEWERVGDGRVGELQLDPGRVVKDVAQVGGQVLQLLQQPLQRAHWVGQSLVLL